MLLILSGIGYWDYTFGLMSDRVGLSIVIRVGVIRFGLGVGLVSGMG